MKITIYAVVIATAFLSAGVWTGAIGITYPRVVETEPLKNPVRILSVRGNTVSLEDGRIIELDAPPEGGDWTAVFQQSDFLVDVVSPRAGEVAIYANQDGWVCGTPWASGFRIPLIPETVYKNRKELVGYSSIQTKEDRTRRSSEPSPAVTSAAYAPEPPSGSRESP